MCSINNEMFSYHIVRHKIVRESISMIRLNLYQKYMCDLDLQFHSIHKSGEKTLLGTGEYNYVFL